MELQSLELDKLFKSLSLAQAEFPTIGSNRKAYTNSYADHYTIMRQVYPILRSHGLSVMPWGGKIDGTQMIGARLCHESGQYIINSYEFVMDELLPQKDKKTHKAAGALTYFKRYHVKDILGVLLSDDPQDDDLQGDYHEKQPQAVANSMQKQPLEEYVTSEQLQHIEHEVGSDKELNLKIRSFYKIDSLQYIPKTQYISTMDKIKGYKQTLRDSGK